MRRAEQLCQSAQAALSLTVGKGKLHQQRQQASKCTVSFPRRGGMSTLAFRTDHNAPIFFFPSESDPSLLSYSGGSPCDLIC